MFSAQTSSLRSCRDLCDLRVYRLFCYPRGRFVAALSSRAGAVLNVHAIITGSILGKLRLVEACGSDFDYVKTRRRRRISFSAIHNVHLLLLYSLFRTVSLL